MCQIPVPASTPANELKSVHKFVIQNGKTRITSQVCPFCKAIWSLASVHYLTVFTVGLMTSSSLFCFISLAPSFSEPADFMWPIRSFHQLLSGLTCTCTCTMYLFSCEHYRAVPLTYCIVKRVTYSCHSDYGCCITIAKITM